MIQPPAIAIKLPQSYASQRNSVYSNTASNFVSVQDRWKTSLGAMPDSSREAAENLLTSVLVEFKKRNPTLRKWSDLKLAEAKFSPMSAIDIDTTMQRELEISWVINLIGNFADVSVVPIHVYREPTTHRLVAWDGQHTIVLLWLLATKIFGEDIANCMVPVCIYQSDRKAAMRDNFIKLNSDAGKNGLSDIDIYRQMIFGVRVDGSDNPAWLEAEKKQQILERYDLFVTHKKFGDAHMPGAIGRMPEINRMPLESLDWLCRYLSFSAAGSRPAAEKEMVMIGHFFERCRLDGVKVDAAYIADLYLKIKSLWDADFNPNGVFWDRCHVAYVNWHAAQPVVVAKPKMSKEPIHGFPFMIAQLSKSFARPLPSVDSHSEFWPLPGDLQ